MKSLKVFWSDFNVKKVKWLEQEVFLKLYAEHCNNEKWTFKSKDIINETLPLLSFVDTFPEVMYRETFGLYYCKEFKISADSNFPEWALPALREATFVPRTVDCDSNPLVCVVIITLDREKTCVDAINSVLNQTYKNFKCIVVKDGPGTYETIPADPRILFLNAPKRGVYPENTKEKWFVAGRDPLNIGLAMTQGPIVCRLDDDDIFLPNHLESIVNAWLSTKANLIYTEPNKLNGGTPFKFEFSAIRLHISNFIYTCNAAFCGAALGLMNIPPVADIPGDWAALRRVANANLKFHKINEITSVHSPETFERKN